MATPILEIPEVSTSILSFALLNIVLRHYEQAASNRIINSLATPPLAPADGDAYFVLASPTGLWSGQAGKIAFSISGAWYFMKAIPQIPYFKTSTNTLVTLNPATATEGAFSSGGGSAGASYYNLTASAFGSVTIPFNTYPTHSVVFVNCSSVTEDYIEYDLGIDILTGTGGKKIEIIFYNAPNNVLYTYRSGSNGIFNVSGSELCYRTNNLFFATYEVNFTTSRVAIHNTSLPADGYSSVNYSSLNPDEVIVLGRHKRGIYTYDGSALSTGAATLTLSWDDTYIQNVYETLIWKIVIYNLPATVTSVVVTDLSGNGNPLEGILTKTPVNGTVAYDWIWTFAIGGWVMS